MRCRFTMAAGVARWALIAVALGGCGSDADGGSGPAASAVAAPTTASPLAALEDPANLTSCHDLLALIREAHRLAPPTDTPSTADVTGLLGYRPTALETTILSINERREALGCVPAVDLDVSQAATVVAQVSTLSDCDQLAAVAVEASTRGQASDDSQELFTLVDFLSAAVDRSAQIGC